MLNFSGFFFSSLNSFAGCVVCQMVVEWMKIWGSLLFQRYEERVIIISSKDKENTVTDAEIALQQIAALILKVIHG